MAFPAIGIGDLDGITLMDLSGIDFGAFTEIRPLYLMGDLTDLWLLGTKHLDAVDLDIMLNNLETIEDTDTECILHMTQADYDALNAAGGGLLAAWNAQPGHHVEFVFLGDYNGNGQVERADLDLVLLNWGAPWRMEWLNAPPADAVVNQDDLDQVLLNWGSGLPVDENAVAVPEPGAAWMILLAVGSLGLARFRPILR